MAQITTLNNVRMSFFPDSDGQTGHLLPVISPAKIRSVKISPAEIRSVKIRSVKISPAEIRSVKIRSLAAWEVTDRERPRRGRSDPGCWNLT